MFGSYRKDDFADPNSFLLQLGMVLSRYSDDIIAKACHPVTGIQRVYRTPPSMAAISEFCTDESDRLARIRELAQYHRVEREPRPKQHRANVFVRPEAPQYAAMVEKAKTGSRDEWRWDTARSGIWVALGWLDDDQAKTAKGWRSFSGDELMAMYGAPAYPPTTPEPEPAAGAAAQ